MPRRMKRLDVPPDPAAVVRALRACRHVLVVEVLARTRPFGPVYRLALAIMTAIDALADHLTGETGYFLEAGSTSGEDRRRVMAVRQARERGEIPWDQ